MNTFKSALRIIWAHKRFLSIYLIGMSLLMLILGANSISQAVQANVSVTVGKFTPAQPKVAVINRDASQEGRALALGLERYLQQSDSQLVKLEDSDLTLQDATATDKADLIVIIPNGYAQDFASAARERSQAPRVDSNSSYNSSRGSLSELKVKNFLSGLRTALISQSQADSPSTTSVSTAVDTALENARKSQTSVVIEQGQSKQTTTLASGFADMASLAEFPLITALTVCLATLFVSFNAADVRRRLLSSPTRALSLSSQQLLACAVLALASWAYYCLATLAVTVLSGGSLAALGTGPILLVFLSMLIYVLAAGAFGFMIGQLNISKTAINGIAVTAGLVIMFTSGAASSGGVTLPTSMTIIGKLPPGWWYCQSVRQAMGLSAAGGGAAGSNDLSTWASPLVLVFLFALAYFCIGLMLDRIHRTSASLSSSPTTLLSELG